MMVRFYACLEKLFHFKDQAARLTDSRREPVIPTAAIWGSARCQAVAGAGFPRLFPLLRRRGRR